MKHRLVVIAIALTSLFPTQAAAQSIEAGGILGRACVGSDGSLCGSDGGAAFGAYLAVWFGPHFAVQGEVNRLGRQDKVFIHGPGVAGPPYEVRVGRTDRSRILTAFQAQYHFGAAEHPVRFFVEGGLAPFVDKLTVSCSPAGCENLPRHQIGGEALGSRTIWHTAVVFGGGLAARLPAHLMLRGAVQWYNLGGDSLATSLASVSLGYRF